MLAAKMPGLCKGGDNVGNVCSFGWLVFLLGGGDDKSDNNTNSDLSIANKIHSLQQQCLHALDPGTS